MARTEILPDGRAVLVPDDMTREEALALTGFAEVAAPPPSGDEAKSDFIDDIQRGIGGLMAGAGSALRDVYDPAGLWLQESGQQIVRDNPADFGSLSDIEGVGDLIGFGTERILETAPQLLGAVGASLVGSPLAGAAVLGGTTGITTYGGAREEQRQAGETDYARALAAGVGAGALDLLGVGRVLPGAGKLLGEVLEGGVRGAIKGGVRIGGEEAATEVAQTALERFGGLQELASPEAMEDYAFSAVSGALVGAPLGAARAAFEPRAGEPAPAQEAPAPRIVPDAPLVPPGISPELASAPAISTIEVDRPDDAGAMQRVTLSVLSEPDDAGNVLIRTPEGRVSQVPEPILRRMAGQYAPAPEAPAAPEVQVAPEAPTPTTLEAPAAAIAPGVMPTEVAPIDVTPPAPAAIEVPEVGAVAPAEVAPDIAPSAMAAPSPEVTAPTPPVAPVEAPASIAIESPLPEGEPTPAVVTPEPPETPVVDIPTEGPAPAPDGPAPEETYVFTREKADEVAGHDPGLARSLVGKTASTGFQLLAERTKSPFYKQIAMRGAGMARAMEGAGFRMPIGVSRVPGGMAGLSESTVRSTSQPYTGGVTQLFPPVPSGPYSAFEIGIKGAPTKTVARGANERTLLHELLHSVTTGAQRMADQFPQGSRVAAALKDMQRLHGEVRRGVADIRSGRLEVSDEVKASVDRLSRSNAFLNERELVAWGLTDYDMQQVLKAIPVKKGNAFTEFVRLIGRMLGVSEGDANALRELIELTEVIIPTEPAAQQEIIDVVSGGQLPASDVSTEVPEGGSEFDVSGERPDVTASESFRRWFGDSKVVDKSGRPLVVYHGSPVKDIRVFDTSRVTTRTPLGDVAGAFFSADPMTASGYARDRVTKERGKTYAAYLSLQNPLDITDAIKRLQKKKMSFGDAKRKALEALTPENDGVVFRGDGYNPAEYVAFRPEQIKSVNNAGTFDPSRPEIDLEQVIPEAPAAALNPQGRAYIQISAKDESGMDKFRRVWADKMRRLGFVEEAIEAATGHPIPRTARPTEKAALFESRAQERLDELERDHTNKILDVMKREDISPNEADLFLLARAAFDRNAKIARRNPSMPDGGSGLTNAEAQAILAEFAASGRMAKMQALAAEVDAMTEKTRQTMVRYGMLRQEQAEALVRDEPFYVPLKGLAEDGDMSVSGDIVHRPPNSGRGFSISRKEFLATKGRSSLPFSPLANAIADAQAAIIRGERNRVGLSFLKDIAQKYDSNAWEVYTDENPERQQIYNSKTKKVEVRPVQMELFPDRYFIVKDEGKPYYIKINDPLLMRALTNGSTKDFATINKILGNTIGMVTQALSRLHTTLNPEFFVPNFARDIEAAVFNILAEQDAVDGRLAGKEIVKNVIKDVTSTRNFRAMFKATFNHEATTAEQRETNALFQQAKEDGAFTGWILRETPEEQLEKIQREIDKTTATGKQKVWYDTQDRAREIFQKIQDFNSVFENVTRFAVYKNALAAGVTRDEAANMARNVTVDFNKKGEAGPTANALYAFFNAAVRGNAQLIRSLTAKTPDGKFTRAQKLAMGMIGFGVLQTIMGRGMSDEDEDGALFYDKIPDWEKQRNLILMMPGGREYIKIPLPYGYSFFHTLGALGAETAAGTKSAGDMAVGIVSGLMNNFSPVPIAGESLSGIAVSTVPTALRPFADLLVNQNFFGSPIYNEPFDENQAMSSVARYSTPEAYKSIVEFLNEATGGRGKVAGAVDLPAESIQYLINSYIGGAGKFGVDLIDFGAKAATGRDIEMKGVPVLRKVLGEPNTQNDLGLYFDRLNEIEPIERQLRDSYGAERRDLREKFPVETNPRVIAAMKEAKRQLKLVNQQKRNLLDRDMDYGEQQDRLDRLNERQHDIYLRFNKIYNEVKEREG